MMKELFKDNESKMLWIRRICLMILDAFCVGISGFMALLIRYEFVYSDIDPRFIETFFTQLPISIIFAIIIFWIFHLYHSLWSYAGIMEMINIVAACFFVAIFQLINVLARGEYLPKSYYILTPVFLAIVIVGTRFMYRYIRSVKARRRNIKELKNIMVIGAGAAGKIIIKEISDSDYLDGKVSCAIDDDKTKQNTYIYGVRVVGDRNTIIENVKKYKISQIVIAMPSQPAKVIKEILDICKKTDCELKTLPGIYQLINDEVNVSRLRNVEIDDLLGREPVSIDTDSIIGYVTGKVILVTGGGGSIGSELCRQIASHNPKQLIIFDIYENNAYDIQQELVKKYPDLDLVVLIGSVRNEARMNDVFATYKPHIVYHAAAHKHVPLMEVSPDEAIKNNVFGTFKTAQMADRYSAEKFVLISTDKAVNPTNIMGASKRMCEMIVQVFSRHSETQFVAVRFGNVLGSNGSVIPLFKKQIEEGGPVTVTHPDIIRYFMTIPEAVSLVLQAGAYAKGGEIFVLDMGEPVKILDLAKNLIRLSGLKLGEDIEIKFTGLRPGEKLFEELLMKEEGLQKTPNDMIYVGKPIEMDEMHFMAQLSKLKRAAESENKNIRDMVKEIVPTYRPEARESK